MVGLHDGRGRGFALLLAAGSKAFGSVMVWAARFEIFDLTLMVDPDAGPGDHARRATALSVSPLVMAVDGTGLIGVDPAPSRAIVGEAPRGVDAGSEILRAAGLDVVIDDGEVIGEYLGLEVARVLPSDDGGDVQVGVGAVDREANRVLYGDATPADVLSRVVSEVAVHRRPGVEFHPLGRMARERWLMCSLVDDPMCLGLGPLARLPATEPRRGLRSDVSVGALAQTPDGPVLVVTTAGGDVGLIGAAADLVDREKPVAMVAVSIPSALKPIRRVLDLFDVPVDYPDVKAPWLA